MCLFLLISFLLFNIELTDVEAKAKREYGVHVVVIIIGSRLRKIVTIQVVRESVVELVIHIKHASLGQVQVKSEDERHVECSRPCFHRRFVYVSDIQFIL